MERDRFAHDVVVGRREILARALELLDRDLPRELQELQRAGGGARIEAALVAERAEARVLGEGGQDRALVLGARATHVAGPTDPRTRILELGEESQQLVAMGEAFVDQSLGRERETHRVVGLDLAFQKWIQPAV
ncbi:MAG: hypothetical protein IPK00_15960 [Deltaproteobacteria bacterium]|nr:hypothetical protein [Deltaproteobacteria bacterium]